MVDTSGRPVRALFIAGLHLGTKRCKAEQFLSCLKRYEPDVIYLVGDMIGYREWKSSWHWPQSHNDVIQKLLRHTRKGKKVFYLPGDRDGFMRHYGHALLGGITMESETIHDAADGRRFLVTHGDEFDLIAPSIGWLGKLGSAALTLARLLSRAYEIVARQFGIVVHNQTYLASAKKEARFTDAFAEAAAKSIHAQHYDGIICGHLPHAASRVVDQTAFFNTGDWRDTSTALVEHEDSTFEVISFDETVVDFRPAPALVPA